MIVQIKINLGDRHPTEENIRQSFDRLMVAKEESLVHDAHDWCRVLDSGDQDEAALELLPVEYDGYLRVDSEFLKSGDLREQHNTNTKERE